MASGTALAFGSAASAAAQAVDPMGTCDDAGAPAAPRPAQRRRRQRRDRRAAALTPREARRWLAVGVALWTTLPAIAAALVLGAQAGVIALCVGVLFCALPLLRRTKIDEGARGDVGVLARVDHPRLFALLDDIARSVGHAPFDSMIAIDDVNAYAGNRAGRPVIGLGMPLLAVEPVWSLTSMLAHEIGHHFAGDLAPDSEQRAYLFLASVGDARGLAWHPIARIARNLARGSERALLRVLHRQEHRADQCGAFVAGKGTTEDSLRRLHAVLALWSNVLDDMRRVVAAGKAPRNAFALLREALAYAEANRELQRVERWVAAAEQAQQRTQEPTTHPPTALRGLVADLAVRRLANPVRDEAAARDLLVDPERVEQLITRRIIERLNDGRALPVIDDEHLARTAMALAEKRVREAIAERAGPAADELPFSGLFQLLYDVLSGDVHKVKWFADLKLGSQTITMALKPFTLDKGPLAAEWLEALLDAAVAHGKLGTVGFGVWRRVIIGDEWWYTPGLAALLAKRQGPWDWVVAALRASER